MRSSLFRSLPADFNPRSPRGERPTKRAPGAQFLIFQSTLPSRGATFEIRWDDRYYRISIHAPLAGSDYFCAHFCNKLQYFNPRSPRGERLHELADSCICNDFNPRSPRGERHQAHRIPFGGHGISIHAPLAGSDSGMARMPACLTYFNPRSPRGERLTDLTQIRSQWKFQSTLPSRGATAPLGKWNIWIFYFNPRSPRGERPRTVFQMILVTDFNPRSPRGERRL